jgi:hypothetical protein
MACIQGDSFDTPLLVITGLDVQPGDDKAEN